METSHLELGILGELTVVGDEEPVLPEADGSITASDHAFGIDLPEGDEDALLEYLKTL
jgi:hypothetical protein